MKAIAAASFSISDGLRERLLEWLMALVRAPGLLETWRLRHKRRMQFAGLDARVLRDTGISEAQRFLVANKPFWEA